MNPVKGMTQIMMEDFKVIRFDIQFLNEAGAPVRQYDVPKIDIKKAVEQILKGIEDDKIYAVNIRKHLTKEDGN